MRGRGFECDPDRLVELQRGAGREDLYAVLDLVEDYVSGMGGRLGYKRRVYAALRSFFMHNRADLPRDGGFQIRSDVPPVVGRIRVEDFRRVLGGCNAMYRAVFLSIFQGIMGLEEFEYWNRSGLPSLRRQLDEGVRPVRVDLPGRKMSRNKRPYYTFLGRDAIDALKVYMEARPRRGGPIFFNKYGRPLGKVNVRKYWLRKLFELGLVRRVHGVRGVRYGMNPHELRDTARTRWRVSGADVEVAEFIMGHDIDKLGYDKSPWTNPEWFEEEYLKAEPWLNVVSEDPERVPLRDFQKLKRVLEEQRREYEEALKILREPGVAEALRRIAGEGSTGGL